MRRVYQVRISIKKYTVRELAQTFTDIYVTEKEINKAKECLKNDSELNYCIVATIYKGFAEDNKSDICVVKRYKSFEEVRDLLEELGIYRIPVSYYKDTGNLDICKLISEYAVESTLFVEAPKNGKHYVWYNPKAYCSDTKKCNNSVVFGDQLELDREAYAYREMGYKIN